MAAGLAEELERRGIVPDASQVAAIGKLEQLREKLIVAERASRSPVARVRRWLRHSPPTAERGIYLWGGVGRGKTLLMDLFHASLPFQRRRRTHFHRFMHDVHAALKVLPPIASPLEVVADRFAADARVICLDELFVSDIADAMLLGGLFQALVDRGVTMVFTSNAPPRQLYRDGLQRQRFEPAIALIESCTTVIAVDGDTDYRMRALRQASLYLDSASPDSPRELARLFRMFSDGEGTEGGTVAVGEREISVVRHSAAAAWFTFADLCEGARSQDDYIEIARDYSALLLTNLPILGPGRDDAARRFIALIDELYDHGVKLALSAGAPPHELYRGTRLAFEFQRASSRLVEMQSEAYLARPHRG